MCENNPGSIETVVSNGAGYTLSGLKPHSKYRIGVAAKTLIAGERVTREVQTHPAVPTAPPANIRIGHVGDTSAEISWHAPPCVVSKSESSSSLVCLNESAIFNKRVHVGRCLAD